MSFHKVTLFLLFSLLINPLVFSMNDSSIEKEEHKSIVVNKDNTSNQNYFSALPNTKSNSEQIVNMISAFDEEDCIGPIPIKVEGLLMIRQALAAEEAQRKQRSENATVKPQTALKAQKTQPLSQLKKGGNSSSHYVDEDDAYYEGDWRGDDMDNYGSD